MKTISKLLALGALISSVNVQAGIINESEVVKTKKGEIRITFLGHASLLIQHEGKNIYIDPSSAYKKKDLPELPKADLIAITHEHFDHLDRKEIEQLSKESTAIIATESCGKIEGATIMKNGDKKSILGIDIEAVPAYNLVHKNPSGNFYHPKGIGNGYILTIDGTRFYVAGDTENIPEMKLLKNIDVAFLPYNLPYTMDTPMFVNAASMVNAKVIYPYHFIDSNLEVLKEALKQQKSEIRIRKVY